jgi:hypothetical protein
VNVFWPLEDLLWAFMLQNCLRTFPSARAFVKDCACSFVPPQAPASRYLDDPGDHSRRFQLLPTCIVVFA